MNDIPKTMRAFVLHGHGGFEALKFHKDWPTPQPKPGEALVQVKACGLNNTDINTRTGWYSKSVTSGTTGGAFDGEQDADGGWDGGLNFPLIQGGDAAGIVVAVGQGVDAGLIGKRCLVDTILRDWDDPMNLEKTSYLGSAADGGYADYLAIDARNINPIETTWSDAELATVAIAYSTAENMLNRASVGAADTVLIPGASGGVGSALVQLANRRGARVIAMASEAKHRDLAKLNPAKILPRAPENLRAALGDEKVTVVADIVGGDQFPALIDVLERGGRYTCSGAIAGPIVSLDLRTFYLRDLSFFGNTIFTPNVFGDLVRYIEAGEIKPMLAASYPFEDLHKAQQAFIDKKHVGNIVVTL